MRGRRVADARGTYGTRPDDGWSPATSVRSSANPAGTRAVGSHVPLERSDAPREHRSGRDSVRSNSATAPPGSAWDRLAEIGHSEGGAAPERGLPGWAALLVLIAIAALGGLIDMLSGTHVRGGFNIGIIVASVVGILVVRRSGMFPVVVAPPIVYSLASGSILYIRSNGLADRRVLIDSAANWLVYGFPAVAAATAAVLIIAGVRMITRR